MESFRAINTLNKVVALVLALVVCFTQSFGRGCMYALLFFLGAFVIQMIMASVNSAHDDSAIERLQLVTGELPDYMKRNIMVATLLLIGLNVGLAVWIFS
jgi:hypothetical protein